MGGNGKEEGYVLEWSALVCKDAALAAALHASLAVKPVSGPHPGSPAPGKHESGKVRAFNHVLSRAGAARHR